MPAFGRIQRRIVGLSLDVLREASERCGERRVDTVAVRLALMVHDMPGVPEPKEWFDFF